MDEPLETLRHPKWRRAFLILVLLVNIITFPLLILPRICRIVLAHVRSRKFSVRNIPYSARRQRNVLDVYSVHDKDDTKCKKICPVVVFCHGGAWSSGDKLHYSLVANTFRKNNIVSVIINYTLHPKGLVEEMVDDVNAALIWTKDNIEQYGGDPDNIYFLGHSAGAHLGALAILKQVVGNDEQNCKSPLLKGFIGLAGPYDIRDHYKYEFTRGVELLSPMGPTMGGIPNFHFHSPSNLVLALKKAHIPRLCDFHILHGDADTTVPISSSIKFAKHLLAAGANTVLLEYKGLGHAHVLYELMDDPQNSPVVQDVIKIIHRHPNKDE